MCIDIDAGKIAALRDGNIPIYEPGLENIVASNVEQERLHFSTSPEEGAKFGDVIMIAVGTPPDEDGSADLRYVVEAARNIGRFMPDFRVVVDKSTVPVGTGDLVEKAIREELDKRGAKLDVVVASNPEFLKEGAAVEDFMKPDRIVLGVENERAEAMLREMYAPFQRNHDRIVVMSRRSAELTKYAANAMLATRISFMNDLANLAESLGADIEDVRQGIGSDPRIGYSFLYAGTGYGGSCFPKDVKALLNTARQNGHDLKVLAAVDQVNEHQKNVLVRKLKARLGDLKGRRIGLWGLAFKPNTDDMREAPARNVLEALWAEGAEVTSYDPVAADECRRIYGDDQRLRLAASPLEAARGAEALLIMTEWKVFRAPAFDRLKEQMAQPLIFDGRNLYDPAAMARRGFEYHGIGRVTAQTAK
jgi:UDPglucose 6-dehydrogenase